MSAAPKLSVIPASPTRLEPGDILTPQELAQRLKVPLSWIYLATYQTGIFPMDKRGPFPDDLGGIRNLVHDLKLDVQDLRAKVEKPSLWKRIWAEKGFYLTLAVLVFGASGTAIHYVADSFVENRIHQEMSKQLEPINGRLSAVEKSLNRIEGSLNIVKAQSLIKNLSSVPTKELRAHKEQLNQIKEALAQSSPTTPDFWPATFQVISLLSQAMWQLQTIGAQPLSVFDNVTFRGGAPSVIPGANALLKNHIEGMVFENSVIHFDPSVELVNVSFHNCVFIFPTETIPSEPLQKIGALLLASDLSNIKIGPS